EAIKLLKNIPHRHSFSYILLDPSGESFVVEASPRNVIARTSNVCTNHFHILDEENRYRQDDSRRREIAMQKEQQFATNPYYTFQLLKHPKHSILPNNSAPAAATGRPALHCLKGKNAWLTIGPDRSPVMFDFQEWLDGHNTAIPRARGEID